MKQSRVDRVFEAVKRYRHFQELMEGTAPFVIYRVDNGTVLARGIYGFEQAKKKASEIRKKLGLKFEDVKFKADRRPATSRTTSRIDYAQRYNPSKRGRFKVRINPDGSTGDID